MFLSTVLDFIVDVNNLGSYINSGLGSLGHYFYIPGGLILAGIILNWTIKAISSFAKSRECGYCAKTECSMHQGERTMPGFRQKGKPLYMSMMNEYHKGAK